MVLEAFLSTKSLKKHAFFMTVFSFIVSSVAIWTAYFAFPNHTSILTIAFISIAMVPLIRQIFTDAEHVQERLEQKQVIHKYLIAIYVFLSIGIILSFIFWYLILPTKSTDFCINGGLCINNVSKENFFSEQLKTLKGIENLRDSLTGQTIAVGSCGNSLGCWFDVIFFNNFFVMVMAIVFSAIYGAGAIFLISWNSSVLGIAIGERIAALQHFAFLGFIPHGIPEFVGYFSAAIAGGLLSAMIMKKRLKRAAALHMMIEILLFTLLAVVSIVAAALIEAFIIVGNYQIPAYLSAVYAIGIVVFIIGIGKKESYTSGVKRLGRYAPANIPGIYERD